MKTLDIHEGCLNRSENLAAHDPVEQAHLRNQANMYTVKIDILQKSKNIKTVESIRPKFVVALAPQGSRKVTRTVKI